MQPQRQEFSGPYQAARQVKGQPMCPYTCPYASCCNPGHGAGDFRTNRPEPCVVLPPERPVPTSAPETSSSSVFVRGFDRKSEGKMQIMVLPLPHPRRSSKQISPLILRRPALLQSSKGPRPLRHRQEFQHQFQPPRSRWSSGCRRASDSSRTSPRSAYPKLETPFCGEA